MHITTLEQSSITDITNAFNQAFADYFIPLQLTEESMVQKIKSEGIYLNCSIGAFEGNELVGFILHGIDVLNGMQTVYNGGTGVVPAYRGKGLTNRMYQFAIPLLLKEGIHHHLLEVIDNNHVAHNIYKSTGFNTVRSLQAYKSTGPIEGNPVSVIKKLEFIPAESQLFSTMEAAWQNSLASIQRDIESHQLIGSFVDDKLIGFAAFVAKTGRVKQCAVHPAYRRKGIARQLFKYMQEESVSGHLVLTNVDESYQPAVLFLESMNFKPFLRLYEMKMEVKP